MLLKIIFLAIFFTGCFCDDEPDDSYLKPKPKPEHPNCNTLNNKFITGKFMQYIVNAISLLQL